MTGGLSPQELADLRAALARFPEIAEAYLFGSRARGDHKPRSDIDLVVKAPALAPETLAALADYLNEETLLPYFIDLVHYEALEDAQLKERVDAQGVKIYSGEPETSDFKPSAVESFTMGS
jgi:predicted nucleotidyltransferase